MKSDGRSNLARGPGAPMPDIIKTCAYKCQHSSLAHCCHTIYSVASTPVNILAKIVCRKPAIWSDSIIIEVLPQIIMCSSTSAGC
jgi:hypothetical protein